MVGMPDSTYPTWWRGGSHPPPAPWKYAFELFTTGDGADEWALAAAVFIAQYRRRHPSGPTFRELFEHLLPDANGVPERLPRDWDRSERNDAIRGFRGQVTAEWHRRSFIGFDRHVTRSLRVGPRFRERSRLLQESKAARMIAVGAFPPPTLAERMEQIAGVDLTQPATETRREVLQATWSVDEVMSRLRLGPIMLRRLSDTGYLHWIAFDDEVRYPDWQFASEAGRTVVPGVSRVVAAMPVDWTLSSIRDFMATPQVDLEVDGALATPVQWLLCGRDPNQVASILRGISQ